MFSGAACALQRGVVYEYKYTGRIATGIPKIRAQVATTEIEADLTVEMASESQAKMRVMILIIETFILTLIDKKLMFHQF